MSFKLGRASPSFKTITIAGFLLFSSLSFSEVVLVVNPNNDIESISREEVRKIYLGKITKFKNGTKAKTLELESGDIRDAFLKNILNRSEASFQSYWARKIFSGKGLPPEPFKTPKELKDAIAKNEGTIGFLDSDDVDSSVKVIELTN